MDAADWFVRLHDKRTSSQVRESFSSWLLLSPGNLAAYIEVAEQYGRTDDALSSAPSIDELIQSARSDSQPSNVVALKPSEESKRRVANWRGRLGHLFRRNSKQSASLLQLKAQLSKLNADRRDLQVALRELESEQRAIEATIAALTSELHDSTKIVKSARRVFGSEAEKWLTQPAAGLDNQRPVDLIQTAEGAKLVNDLLARITFGVYT